PVQPRGRRVHPRIDTSTLTSLHEHSINLSSERARRTLTGRTRHPTKDLGAVLVRVALDLTPTFGPVTSRLCWRDNSEPPTAAQDRTNNLQRQTAPMRR